MNATVRAKTKDGIMWVSGNIVDLDNNGKRYGIIHSLTYDLFDGKARGSVVEIDPATICHPIGLYDRYEQEIYTNDIFYHRGLNAILVAAWDESKRQIEFEAYQLCGEDELDVWHVFSFSDIAKWGTNKIDAIPFANLYDNKNNPLLQSVKQATQKYGLPVTNKETERE